MSMRSGRVLVLAALAAVVLSGVAYKGFRHFTRPPRADRKARVAMAIPDATGNVSGTLGDPLFIPHERIAAIKAAASRGTPEWRALKDVVDQTLAEPEFGESKFMNAAVVYLGTGDRKYCERLGAESKRAMTAGNPRGDSYAVYASYMQWIAATLTTCGDVLDKPLRDEMLAYLDRWTDEIWFKNQGTGWGLKDPGNNYHISFLLGTAC